MFLVTNDDKNNIMVFIISSFQEDAVHLVQMNLVSFHLHLVSLTLSLLCNLHHYTTAVGL